MGGYIVNTDSLEFKASTKDILNALIYEGKWLLLIKEVTDELKVLIDFIQTESVKRESDQYRTISVKAVSTETGISSAKISKYLSRLYENIWNLNLSNPNLFFSNTNYASFYFIDSLTKQRANFNLSLSYPIHVGDNFSWSFLIGKFSNVSFYVESINHEHEYGITSTQITLKNNNNNNYRKFLIEKASFLDLIKFDELITLSDYKIDELLRYRVEKGLNGFPESMAKEAEYFSKKKHRY